MKSYPNSAHYIAMQVGRCPLSSSLPGMAKTSSLHAFAKATGRKIYVLIGSIRDPSDFGIPFPSQDGLCHFSMAPPKWAADLCDGDKWIVVLDELLCSPPAIQAGMLRLVAERYVGDLALPADTWICALTNPTSTATNGFSLEPALANRMVHLDWKMDWASWDHGVTHGAFPAPKFPVLPEDWRQHRTEIGLLVAAFRQHMPDHFAPRTDENGEVLCDRAELSSGWASPRSWDMGIDCLAGARAVDAPQEVRDELLRGCVGSAANAFLEWQDNLDLPDPGKLVDSVAAAIQSGDPIPYKHPNRVDKVLALLYSVAHNICSDPESKRYTKKRWEAGMEIFAQAAEHGAADVMLACAANMLRAGDRALMPRGAKVPASFKKYYPMVIEALS